MLLVCPPYKVRLVREPRIPEIQSCQNVCKPMYTKTVSECKYRHHHFNSAIVPKALLRDPSFRPAPLTSFHSVFSWPSFGQHIFWVSNITLFCPAFQKVFVYYHLPWPVAPRSKISIYFEFLTLPSFVQHSQKFLFTYPINVKFVSLLSSVQDIQHSQQFLIMNNTTAPPNYTLQN